MCIHMSSVNALWHSVSTLQFLRFPVVDSLYDSSDELLCFVFFSSRRRHTRYWRDWSSDVCSSDLHITPSWDMTQLLVNNEESGTFTVIDPRTGRPTGDSVPVTYPYNFYYTPDGEKAIVVAERLGLIGFRDTETWELVGSVDIPWPGVDHLDFSADGDYFLASSEWSGVVSKVDTNTMELVDYVEVGMLPIDIKLSPDGSVFYVADQGTMGVYVIDPVEMEVLDFIPTAQGAHGLQVSRDTKSLYVANRLEGTISVIDFETRQI